MFNLSYTEKSTRILLQRHTLCFEGFLHVDSCIHTGSFWTVLDSRCMTHPLFTYATPDRGRVLHCHAMAPNIPVHPCPCTTLYTRQLVHLEVELLNQRPVSSTDTCHLVSLTGLYSWEHCELPFPHILTNSEYKDVSHFCQLNEYKTTARHLICISLIPKGYWTSLQTLIRHSGFFFCEIHTFCHAAVRLLVIYL